MSKLKYILPLTLLFMVAIPAVNSFAYSYMTYTEYGEWNYEIYDTDPVPVVQWRPDHNGYDVIARLLKQGHGFSSREAALDDALISQDLDFDSGVSGWGANLSHQPQFFGEFVNNTGEDLPFYKPPAPDLPTPSEDWISDMWDWFMYIMGWGDDPSIIQITGGDKIQTEIVTPTPSPTQTPTPSPTPYILPIKDATNGTVIWNVELPQTGGGGDTINNYDVDGFDIFDVDLKIGNGGTSKPKDDLNNVMRTNNDYIQDMDVSAVKESFSVLPVDWYIMIGVLASLPIIAGLISKMLK